MGTIEGKQTKGIANMQTLYTPAEKLNALDLMASTIDLYRGDVTVGIREAAKTGNHSEGYLWTLYTHNMNTYWG